MTDTLATKQDLDVIRERMQSLERHMDTRFVAQDARMDAKLADLERRMTMRLGGITVAGIGVVSVLVRMSDLLLPCFVTWLTSQQRVGELDAHAYGLEPGAGR